MNVLFLLVLTIAMSTACAEEGIADTLRQFGVEIPHEGTMHSMRITHTCALPIRGPEAKSETEQLAGALALVLAEEYALLADESKDRAGKHLNNIMQGDTSKLQAHSAEFVSFYTQRRLDHMQSAIAYAEFARHVGMCAGNQDLQYDAEAILTRIPVMIRLSMGTVTNDK